MFTFLYSSTSNLETKKKVFGTLFVSPNVCAGLPHGNCNVCVLFSSLLRGPVFYSVTVGNKNDCPEKKVVQTEDAQKFADQIGIQLYETSAKENLNVEEVCMSVWWKGFSFLGGEVSSSVQGGSWFTGVSTIESAGSPTIFSSSWLNKWGPFIRPGWESRSEPALRIGCPVATNPMNGTLQVGWGSECLSFKVPVVTTLSSEKCYPLVGRAKASMDTTGYESVQQRFVAHTLHDSRAFHLWSYSPIQSCGIP